jgi:plasmid stability protein
MRTLTLKNVPDELYEELKCRAAAHRRSLNQEAIVSLSNALERRDPAVLLAQADALRERLAARGASATAEEVDRWIEEGRS